MRETTSAALQQGQWNRVVRLSRGLAGVEHFLATAGLDLGPWLTVAFAVGIAAWFVLPGIAQWTAFCVAGIMLAGAVRASGRRLANFPHVVNAIIWLAVLAVAGMGTIWLRSVLVGTPPITRPIAGTYIARVLSLEEQPAQARSRLTLAMNEPGTGRPIKVRINLGNGSGGLPPGQGALIRFKARLMPPAPPMLPGGYDFARTAWFSGLAATGSAFGPVEIIQPGESRDWLAAKRLELGRFVRTRLGEREAGIAAAFITGDEGAISQDDNQAMRDSGLAHLLSVSGLHVSAVIAASYFIVVRLAGLFPWIALRVPLPIAGAAAGVIAGIGYTLLTGSQVPTVRSCIGALLVLGAVVLGRQGLSLRLLAAAAFVVLLLWPEAIVGASFQLSFAAVLAIIALSGCAPMRQFLSPREERWSLRVLRHLAGVLLTGLVIELVLMPIGFFHFHRAGVFGALANVVAIPLTTFVIMPLIATALAFDVVGLGAPLWWLAERAIAVLLAIAHGVAGYAGAVKVVPAFSGGAYALFIAGGLWLALWKGRIRLLGLLPAGAGALILFTLASPDILVSDDGRNVGLLDETGKQMLFLREARSSYVSDTFAELAGITNGPRPLESSPAARCNRDFCVFTMKRSGRNWSILMTRGRDSVPERALAAACERVDIVIADRWLPRSCHPGWLRADRSMLNETGGLAINLSSRRIQTVAQTQGRHGWWLAQIDQHPYAFRPQASAIAASSGAPGEAASAVAPGSGPMLAQ